ncbi:hypothetical protein EG833_02880, partial [archaeon]|nr:hypothetical protein [archaeon]
MRCKVPACRPRAGVLVTPWIVFTLALSGCTGRYFHDVQGPVLPAVQYGLDSLPVNEYWTGIVFNGNKIGFTHFIITPSGMEKDTYEIRSRAVMHLRFLMMEKSVSLSSYDLVDKDLHLLRFDYEYNIDDSRLRLTGSHAGGVLRVVKSSGGPAA